MAMATTTETTIVTTEEGENEDASRGEASTNGSQSSASTLSLPGMGGGHANVQSGHGRLSHQDGAAVTASLYSSRCNLLVADLSTGMFGLFELPSMSNVHKLSISNRSVRSACIDPTGK